MYCVYLNKVLTLPSNPSSRTLPRFIMNAISVLIVAILFKLVLIVSMVPRPPILLLNECLQGLLGIWHAGRRPSAICLTFKMIWYGAKARLFGATAVD